MFDIPGVGRFINTTLIKEPMNWGIVFIFATVSLLLMHVVMMAFVNMQATTQGAFGGGPGQVMAPQTSSTGMFSGPGTLAQGPSPGGTDLGQFYGNAGGIWTDGYESKYAEDGWLGYN